MSGARSGAQVTGQVISAIDIADISIRALREEGDVQLGAFVLLNHLFLSTPSVRRATRKLKKKAKMQGKFLSTPSARRATAS